VILTFAVKTFVFVNEALACYYILHLYVFSL